MKLFRIGIIVIPSSEPAHSEESELATVAHCVRLHADREQVFLQALAAYVPPHLLFQWRTLLHESAYVSAWMGDLGADAEATAAAA